MVLPGGRVVVVVVGLGLGFSVVVGAGCGAGGRVVEVVDEVDDEVVEDDDVDEVVVVSIRRFKLSGLAVKMGSTGTPANAPDMA